MVYASGQEQDPDDDGSVRTAEQASNVARGFLSVAAPDGGSGVEAVLLVVSELIANAVQHAGGVTGFRLDAGPGRVTVADASRLPLRPMPWDAGKPGGFGWHVVQELSTEVRVRVHAAGKTVTAVVPCPTADMPRG